MTTVDGHNKPSLLARVITGVTLAIVIISIPLFILILSESDSFSQFFTKLFGGELGFKPSLNTKANISIEKGEFSEQLSPELELFITTFFTERGEVLGFLPRDNHDGESVSENLSRFSALYENDSPDRNIDKLILEREVLSRLSSKNPLWFSVFDTTLSITAIGFGDNDFVEIKLIESFSTTFEKKSSKEGKEDIESSYTGVEHFFTLDKRSGKWKIHRHEDTKALSIYIREELRKLLEVDGHSLGSINTNSINGYVSQLKSLLNRDTYYDNSFSIDGRSDSSPVYPYDRGAAISFAERYTDRGRQVRNPVFKTFPRNGTNFTSQCINAGGIPANSGWTYDENNTAGQSAFINAQSFYEYITGEGSRIVAATCEYGKAEVGDIVQFLDGGGGALQSALITKVVMDEKGEVTDYLLTANSEDLTDFPLSALGFDTIRFIKIYGHC